MPPIKFDFFIAYADPDHKVAQHLYGLLSPRVRVFLDSAVLQLGDDWDIEVGLAHRASRITIVLVSEHTPSAFYQREEVAAAVAMSRSAPERHRVVPLLLGERPRADLPYGLLVKAGLVVGNSLSLEDAAARLLDLATLAEASAAEMPGSSARASAQRNRVPSKDLVAALFSRDPTESLPAIDMLSAEGNGPVSTVVGRLQGLNEVQMAVARMYLAIFPAESASLMSDLILDADRNWQKATQVPACFSPEHQPFAVDTMVRNLDHGAVDVVRLCAEALGHLAAKTWAFRLDKLMLDHSDYEESSLNRYYFEKYSYYALVARTRIITSYSDRDVQDTWALPTAFSALETLLGCADLHGLGKSVVTDVGAVMAGCKPAHADRLQTVWLRSSSPLLRRLGVRALGQMGLQRALPSLEPIAADYSAPEELRHDARFAIAGIGGPRACSILGEMLTQHSDASDLQDVSWALAHCVAEAEDDESFEKLVRKLLTVEFPEKCWVYRAIGLRGDTRFVEPLMQGLDDPEPTTRAHCALALARTRGEQIASRLAKVYQEAGGGLERIFIALAMLHIGMEVPGDHKLTTLRADLARDSYLYKRLSQRDIVSTLEATKFPAAAELGTAWRTMYDLNPVSY
jgi:hypothetical protein